MLGEVPFLEKIKILEIGVSWEGYCIINKESGLRRNPLIDSDKIETGYI